MKTDQELSDIATLWLVIYFGSMFIALFFFHSEETSFRIFLAGPLFCAGWALLGVLSKLWRYLKERRR